MSLTPEDIHGKRFHDAFRGYNHEEVDVFLDEVAASFQAAFAEAEESRTRLQQIEGQLEDVKGTEGMLKRTLLAAQRAADEAIAEAKAEAGRMVAAAQDEAAETLAEARRQAEAIVGGAYARQVEIEELAARLRTLDATHRSILRNHLQGQLRAIDELPPLPDPPGGPTVSSPFHEDPDAAPAFPAASADVPAADVETAVVETEPEAEAEPPADYPEPEAAEPEPAEPEWRTLEPDAGELDIPEAAIPEPSVPEPHTAPQPEVEPEAEAEVEVESEAAPTPDDATDVVPDDPSAKAEALLDAALEGDGESPEAPAEEVAGPAPQPEAPEPPPPPVTRPASSFSPWSRRAEPGTDRPSGLGETPPPRRVRRDPPNSDPPAGGSEEASEPSVRELFWGKD